MTLPSVPNTVPTPRIEALFALASARVPRWRKPSLEAPPRAPVFTRTASPASGQQLRPQGGRLVDNSFPKLHHGQPAVHQRFAGAFAGVFHDADLCPRFTARTARRCYQNG